MHSVAKIALAFVVGAGIVGAIAWWEHGAFDRLVLRGDKESLSDSDWVSLTEHIDDPRVLGPVAEELSSASAGVTCNDSFKRADLHVGVILARQKTSDDVSLQAIAHMMTHCNEPKLLTWTSRPAADIVKALHDHEIASLDAAPPNVLSDMLLRLEPKVDQSLVDLILASTKEAPSSVDAFWMNGFPPDGADFVSGGPTIAPPTDPRQTHGIAQWLWALQDPGAYGIQPEAAAAMLRILDHITPPKLDDKIARCLGLADGKEPDAIKLCQRLATPADKDLIMKAVPNPSDQAGCLLALADQDVATKVLNGSDSKETKIAALTAMGPKAIPVLEQGVMSSDPATRKVAEKSLAVLDRHRFAIAIARSFRAGAAGYNDADEVEKLLTDPPLELDAWFSLFATAHEPTIQSVVAFVKDKSKPDEWVPALFGGLTQQDTQRTSAIAGYRALLEGTDGVGPIVGAILTHALAVAGTPEKVDWLTKLLALKTLAAKGTAKDAPAIEPFVADTSNYEEVTTKRDAKGVLVEQAKVKQPFSGLAAQALAAAKAR